MKTNIEGLKEEMVLQVKLLLNNKVKNRRPLAEQEDIPEIDFSEIKEYLICMFTELENEQDKTALFKKLSLAFHSDKIQRTLGIDLGNKLKLHELDQIQVILNEIKTGKFIVIHAVVESSIKWITNLLSRVFRLSILKYQLSKAEKQKNTAHVAAISEAIHQEETELNNLFPFISSPYFMSLALDRYIQPIKLMFMVGIATNILSAFIIPEIIGFTMRCCYGSISKKKPVKPTPSSYTKVLDGEIGAGQGAGNEFDQGLHKDHGQAAGNKFDQYSAENNEQKGSDNRDENHDGNHDENGSGRSDFSPNNTVD